MAIFAKPKRLPALRRQAEQTLKSLKRSRSSKGSVYLTVSSDSSPISIPSDAVFYLEQILEHMAKGQQVEILFPVLK